MAELYHSINNTELEADLLDVARFIEALLFVSPTALTLSQLAAVLEMPPSKVKQGLDVLQQHYGELSGLHGVRLQLHSGAYQMTTAPEAAEYVERLFGLEISGRLTAASLETLAIIAYQQPVTRPQIDEIRGVNSDGVLRGLLAKGLINEVGRANTPGRPILYSTSAEFLQHFGLESISDLPPLNLEGEKNNPAIPNIEGQRDGNDS